MRVLKSSWLARFIVLLLLAWTAVDLANASLCALDQERLPTQEATGTVVDDADYGEPASSAPVHIDDCFCCSHCVDVVSPVAALHPSPLLALARFDPGPHPHSASYGLDHPPQLRG